MIRANIKNRAFDRMGERWAPLIDPDHFLGRTAFDIPYPKKEDGPPATLKLKGDLFLLEIPVAGFVKDNLEVEIRNELLFVSGSKSSEREAKEGAFIEKSLTEDTFERIFKLAPSISREGVRAQLEKGILKITFTDVPPEQERTQRIVEISEG